MIISQKLIYSNELYISSNGMKDGLLYEYILKKKAPLDDVLDFSLNNNVLNFELDKIHVENF